jgi:hypothetical protein
MGDLSNRSGLVRQEIRGATERAGTRKEID